MRQSKPLLPTMTEKRREWLTRLRDRGPAQRHSVVGYQCMRLGWTGWWVTLKDGRQMPLDEAQALFPPPDDYSKHILRGDGGEYITAKGLAALSAA